ncbi:GNAT family N-acetyltransferase [Vogesella oryzae]|uniref:GNAT family N-acetyltransferase n=1 Tax=Vogesella oryzae TaxID=1735285 RepID=UPI001582CF3C|nr:GNAT family N-acetyltransferase [Vogesella oryzae]
MDKLVCRLAGEADVEAIRSVLQGAFAPLLAVVSSRPTALDEDAATLRQRLQQGQQFALGEQAGRAVATACLLPTPQAGVAEIKRVAVLPEMQGQGCGQQLLAWLEPQARALGYVRLRLSIRRKLPGNLAFYLRCGYVPIGEEPHPRAPDYGIVWLEKDLL